MRERILKQLLHTVPCKFNNKDKLSARKPFHQGKSLWDNEVDGLNFNAPVHMGNVS